MNNFQEKKIQMFLTVEAYCKANAAVTQGLPNFSVIVDSLAEKNSALSALTEKHQLSQVGTTVNVGQLKEKLVELALDTSRKLTAYASYTKDLVLLNEVQFNKSSLMLASGQKLTDLTTGLYNRAQSRPEALLVYGITEESQTALMDAIGAYSQWYPQTRLRNIDTQEINVKISSILESIDQELKQMDILVEIVRDTRPEFYTGYKASRKIMVRRASILSLKAQVVRAGDQEPLPGVALVFTGAGEETAGEKLERKTADKGICYIKSMIAGDYVVKATRPGYVSQEFTISVADAEMYRLSIELQTNGN